MKTLIVAEKPSVARDIAQALEIAKGLENNELIISHCIGHLIQLDVPEADGTAQLPIIPKTFNLKVVDRVKEQYKKLKELMDRKDVNTIVNACDAGREGELIFRLVYEKAKCNKPIERMWLQSMTPDAIRQAWQNKQPGENYNHLYDAALSRSQADWLIGINGSRAVKTAIGRVMTPTLAMVVKRYQDNKNFKPEDYFELIATFSTSKGSYQGKWVDKDLKDKKFTQKQEAQLIIDRLTGFAPNKITFTEEVTDKMRNAPALFHLTSLQQVANNKLGLSASETLTIAQSLYEKHKAITYPRTDADALPEDYIETTKQTLSVLSKRFTQALKPLDKSWVTNNKKVFNNSRISDHFAIIPTLNISAELSDIEYKVYELIVKRFIAVFYPPAHYQQTVRLTHADQDIFKSSGNVLIKPGWLEVYSNQDDSEEQKDALLKLDEGELINLSEIEARKGQTKPPALFTEATLLKAMETAGKQIEDEELALILKDKGIGTPATRAAIIEKLKSPGKNGAYIEIKKKTLVPTPKAEQLIEYLSQTAADFISPELTGEWEYRLSQIEKGLIDKTNFMKQINQSVYDLVGKLLTNKVPTMTQANTLGLCPCCQLGQLINRKYSYMCDCGFKINKEYAGYKLTKTDLNALIEDGKTKKIQKFISKNNKSFAAQLKIDQENKKVVFNF